MKLSLPEKRTVLLMACAAALFLSAGQVQAQKPTPLTIMNQPLPQEIQNKVGSGPRAVADITAQDVLGTSYYQEGQVTTVGRKVNEMRNDLFSLQDKVADMTAELSGLENEGQRLAAEYYASVATINTQLQSGTTPGNPRLVAKLDIARHNLETLSKNIAALNNLAVEITNAASMSAFLVESVRATYGLSGAIEEDHMRLAQLEDAANSAIVLIDRLLNNVNADINRTVAYLATERENLQTMALAINAGDLFGRSLTNRALLSQDSLNAQPTTTFMPDSHTNKSSYVPPQAPPVQSMSATDIEPSASNEKRPLVKIRFDRANVSYEQPVYMAVHEALNRYPDANFQIVGIHPSQGNAAEVAISSTRSRRNAESVMRSLTQMGLGNDRVELSYEGSEDVLANEVHVYIR